MGEVALVGDGAPRAAELLRLAGMRSASLARSKG